MKPWSTIIIDDEKLARQRLKRLLTQYDEINIVAEGENGQEGLALIQEHRPDLIFLDIEMPVLNGFEMLEKLDVALKVIFTTAYDQYAIKAFEEGSIDYLLKPIEAERLEKTVNKLKATQMSSQPLELEQLLQKLQPKKEIKTITVKIGDRILLLKVSDLTHIIAEDKYVFLHTQDHRKYLSDFTLSALAEKLPDHFVRINRSALINSEYIKEIRKGFNGSFVFILNDYEETRITSSRSHSQSIRTRFDL